MDCYNCASANKTNLLTAIQDKFGLQYEVVESAGVNATGSKAHYYSLNTRAANFGYQPVLTSLEGILQDMGAILKEGG